MIHPKKNLNCLPALTSIHVSLPLLSGALRCTSLSHQASDLGGGGLLLPPFSVTSSINKKPSSAWHTQTPHVFELLNKHFGVRVLLKPFFVWLAPGTAQGATATVATQTRLLKKRFLFSDAEHLCSIDETLGGAGAVKSRQKNDCFTLLMSSSAL